MRRRPRAPAHPRVPASTTTSRKVSVRSCLYSTGRLRMEIANVAGTAFVVAEFRADENRAARRLYYDPIVPLFLTEQSRDAAARVEACFPPVKDLVKLRTRYLDDALDLHLRHGYRQVLILGAGLDTRAVRKSAPGVAYFEIDDVTTLAWKQECY